MAIDLIDDGYIKISILEDDTLFATFDETNMIFRYEINPLFPNYITKTYINNYSEQDGKYGGYSCKIYDKNSNELVAIIYADLSIEEDILIYKHDNIISIPMIIAEVVDYDCEKYLFFHYNLDIEYNENNPLHYDLFHNKLK